MYTVAADGSRKGGITHLDIPGIAIKPVNVEDQNPPFRTDHAVSPKRSKKPSSGNQGGGFYSEDRNPQLENRTYYVPTPHLGKIMTAGDPPSDPPVWFPGGGFLSPGWTPRSPLPEQGKVVPWEKPPAQFPNRGFPVLLRKRIPHSGTETTRGMEPRLSKRLLGEIPSLIPEWGFPSLMTKIPAQEAGRGVSPRGHISTNLEPASLTARALVTPQPVLESANPAWTRSVHLDAPGQRHGH